MPLPETPWKPETAPEEVPTTPGGAAVDAEIPAEAVDPKAPLSFVPHSAAPQEPFVLRTSRFGDLDEHELVKLIDSIEDERARARFRESIYISVFVWIVIAWVAFYGPKYLWHAPKLIDPITALKQKELTILNAPVIPRPPVMHAAPKLDNRTLERLRREAPPMPSTAPPLTEPAPSPAPAATMAPTPSAPVPPPNPANVRPSPAPSVPDAPLPAAPKPSFSTGGSSAPSFSGRSGGGDFGTSRAPNGASMGTGGIDVLSDTEGVDFSAYFRRMHTDIMNNWGPLLPVETQPPLMKNGETFIIVKIMADGTIGDMKLDYSTHDDAINKSAWGSIVSEGQFPPLPKQFHGPYLILRLKYYVNEQPR